MSLPLWRVRHAAVVVPVLLQLVVGLQWRRGCVLRPRLLLRLCWSRARAAVPVPVPVAVAVRTEVAAAGLLLLLLSARCFSGGPPGTAAVAVVGAEDCRHPVHQHGEEQRQDEGCDKQVSVALHYQLACWWRIRLRVKVLECRQLLV